MIGEDDTCLSDTIGRIPVISLNSHTKEQYFLRTLLYHVAAPKSFDDLKRVETSDGVIMCKTFHEACIKHGLFEDDDEIEKSLDEAASFKMPKQFRKCFVTLVLFAMPANPRELYDKFKVQLCEDFMKQEKVLEPTENTINRALLHLHEMFDQAGINMVEQLGLPQPNMEMSQHYMDNPREVQEELDRYDPHLVELAESNVEKLNKEQRNVFEVIKNSVDNETGLIVALDAPGGTGKTFVLETLLSHVRGQGKIAIATATSGIAANLLQVREQFIQNSRFQ